MTKTELIDAIALRNDIKLNASEKIVNAFFEILTNHFLKGHHVELRKFGSFHFHHYKAYLARNPKTGENFMNPEKKSYRWKTSKFLLERINYL